MSYPDAITETPTFVSWMIIRVGNSSTMHPAFLSSLTEGDYYDLSLVPERFTGYSGPDAHRVWRSIYDENCFGLSEMRLMAGKSPAPVSLPDSMVQVFADDDSINHTEHCLEKRVYYKVISGSLTSYPHSLLSFSHSRFARLHLDSHLS